MYLIRELEDAGKIPILPVRVDSPMAAQATQVYNRLREEHDEEYASILTQKRHPLRTGSMQITATREESKRLNNEKGARIIVSASGMITGGRVMHHTMRVCLTKTQQLSLSAIRRQERPDEEFWTAKGK